jgi:hypothetical protein
MGNENGIATNGHADGVHMRVQRRKGILKLEVWAEFGECVFLDKLGSISHKMGSTLTLGEDYVGKEKAGAVQELMITIADSMRSRAERRNDAIHADSVRRAIKFREAQQRIEAEHRERQQAEGAQRFEEGEAERQRQLQQTGYRGPAQAPPAAAPPHQGAPAMVEGHWNQATGQIDYPQQQQPPPSAPAPQRQNGHAPQAGYRMAPPVSATRQQPPPRGTATTNKPPKNPSQLGGWLKSQSQEVKQLVKDIMSQEGWGWQCNALSQEEAMWVCQIVHQNYPEAGAV